MANSSIYAAFERMWQHVIAKIGTKADLVHTHDDYVTNVYADENFALKSEIENIDLSTYETKTDSQTKLDEAKTYADSAANTVKNDLLNGAGAAYDTLKELGDLIKDNTDAIDALNTVAVSKAEKDHTHDLYETKEDAQVKYDTIVDAKADWNQNDETAIDYVKNRTHWVEEVIEVLLSEQSVATSGDFNYVNLSEELKDSSICSGQTFIVTVDGVSYRCVSWDIAGETRIGDSRLQGADNPNSTIHPEDVPFLIDYYTELEGDSWFGGEEIVYAGIIFSTAGTHTLQIERVNPDQTTYHPLDENFIPETIARQEYVDSRVNNHVHCYYGVCLSGASNTIKQVGIPGFTLVNGAMAIIKFENGHSINIMKLQINSTSTKNVDYNDEGTSVHIPTIEAGDTVTFVYDETEDRYNLISIDRWGRDIDNVRTYVDTNFALKSDIPDDVDLSNYETTANAQIKYENAVAHSDENLETAKSYTDTKTDGLASTSEVDTKVSNHNTDTDAHSDIRGLITGLNTRLNTLADSDDTTLDQMSEIVAYTKNNKGLIDSITTSKVNVSDIVNNLTTNVSNKPLSAAQGVELKKLIDTEVSALEDSIDDKAERVHTHDAADITSGELEVVRLPVVPAEKGGTGETTLKKSANALINSLDTGNSAPKDDDYFVSQYVGGGTTNTNYYRRPMSYLWNYIKGKIEAYMTGGISSVITTNFTASRAIISDADGKLKSSAVTSTELGYLDGVTSAVQTQIDGKAPTSHASTATTYGKATSSNYGHVKLSDSTSSTSGVSGGIAATPAAVKAVYDYADGLTAADVGALGFVRQITAGEDLNNIIDIGSYFVASSNASSVSNMPAAYAIALYVLSADSTKTRILQIATRANPTSTNSNLLWYRVVNKADAQFGEWKTLATTDTALMRDGSNAMTGALTIDRSNGTLGKSQFFKHNASSVDYGTQVRDEDKDGNVTALVVRATEGRALLFPDGNTGKEILHTGNKNLITASDVGAVAWDGSNAMTGDLTISKSNARVRLLNPNGKGGVLRQYDNATTLSAYNDASNTANYRRLKMQDSANQPDIAQALVFQDVTEGKQTDYTIIHTGNKNLITAADVGAAAIEDHAIQSYKSLGAIGLTDSTDMAYNESDVETSVVGNLLKIYNALPQTSELRIYGYSSSGSNPNLWRSLLAKRNVDLSRTGTSYALNMTFVKNGNTTMDVLLKPTYTSICDEEYRCIFRYSGTNGATSTVTVMTCPYDTGNKPTAADVGAATSNTYTATVGTAWAVNGSFYYQDIAVNGILATDNPVVDILCGDNNELNVTYSDCMCKVFRITTFDNKIRLWSNDPIIIEFPIQLKVVR